MCVCVCGYECVSLFRVSFSSSNSLQHPCCSNTKVPNWHQRFRALGLTIPFPPFSLNKQSNQSEQAPIAFHTLEMVLLCEASDNFFVCLFSMKRSKPIICKFVFKYFPTSLPCLWYLVLNPVILSEDSKKKKKVINILYKRLNSFLQKLSTEQE